MRALFFNCKKATLLKTTLQVRDLKDQVRVQTPDLYLSVLNLQVRIMFDEV